MTSGGMTVDEAAKLQSFGSNKLRDTVAATLVTTCAAFYGDRVPETFDMTLSNLMADAAIDVVLEECARLADVAFLCDPCTAASGVIRLLKRNPK